MTARDLRQARGLTVNQLAGLAGVEPLALRLSECLGRPPDDLEAADRIAAALGTEAEWLWPQSFPEWDQDDPTEVRS